MIIITIKTAIIIIITTTIIIVTIIITIFSIKIKTNI